MRYVHTCACVYYNYFTPALNLGTDFTLPLPASTVQTNSAVKYLLRGEQNIIIHGQMYFDPPIFSDSIYYDLQWYHNGSRVVDGESNSSLSSQQIQLSLNIHNTSEDTLGIYEGIVITRIYNILDTCYDLEAYLRYLLGIRRLVLVYVSVTVMSYGKLIIKTCNIITHTWYFHTFTPEPPHVIVSTEKVALSMKETTILTCSAEDGNPDTHTLSWIKDGHTLNSSEGNSLTYNILYYPHNPYGVYTCVVESLYTTEEKSLLIQEEGECMFMQVQHFHYLGSIRIAKPPY